MLGWLGGNWDKVLSVVSFAQSLYAQRQAGTAKAKVERFVARDQVFRATLRLERARSACRELQDFQGTANSSWPRTRCDMLREELLWLVQSEHLSDDLTSRFQAAIAELRLTIKNTRQAKAWIRLLAETLVAAQVLLEKRLQESVE